MTETSAVTLPPPEADSEALALTFALIDTGPFTTERILMSAAKARGVGQPHVTVPFLVNHIGTLAAQFIAESSEARIAGCGHGNDFYMTLFSGIREYEESEQSSFGFLAEEDFIDFGFLEDIGVLPTLLNAGDELSVALGNTVTDQFSQAVLSYLRSAALLNIDRHFWRRVHYTRSGERVTSEQLRIAAVTGHVEAVAFFVAAFTPISAHEFYKRTMAQWVARINGVWDQYASETEDCSNCQSPFFGFDGYEVDGGIWCGSCREESAFHCDGCDNVFHTDEENYGPGDNYVCDTCLRDRCWRCDCGELRWNDERCSDCYDPSDGDYGSLRVNYYSYKPDPIFHYVGDGDPGFRFGVEQSYSANRDTDDGIYFGMELETNIRSGGSYAEGGEALYNSALVSGMGFIYAKSDCTVSGPELVTHPATLAAHRRLWEQFPFRELTRHRWSGWAGANAGCHIHIDRRAFRNKAHLARFQLYFGSWRDELIGFGGRHCQSYGYHGDNMRGARRAVAYATQRQYPARGSAINYENRATIEVRMFRASLRQATVMAYLEFLHGLIHYSATHGSKHIMSEDGLAFSTFAEWLNNNSNGNYDNAVTRITERVSA